MADSLGYVCGVWDYDVQVLTINRREGECNFCGDCCRVPFRYLHWKDLSRKVYKPARFLFEQPGCPAFVNGRCTTYPQRPDVCRYFPMGPVDLQFFPHCTFRFVEVERRPFVSEERAGRVIEVFS